ncbi:hypothetical protein [Rubrobacter calidifluminis]|uniref:hypothetical protein n=1 Tax=Rubrobacter calidifluminis TaxID=1392640 RepID=UPI00235FBC9B|nr:hypothetical protein [Rubrobacter calidifluminis]
MTGVMRATTARSGSARRVKALSLAYMLLGGAACALASSGSYEPPSAPVALYLSTAVLVAGAFALLLMPGWAFTLRTIAGSHLFYAAFVSLVIFFTGGAVSELYPLYLPLLLSAALCRSRVVQLLSTAGVLLGYLLAALPGLLVEDAVPQSPAVIGFRLLVFLALGTLGALGGSSAPDSGKALIRRAEAEIAASPSGRVAAILVDPGRRFERLPLLMQRVGERVAPASPLGEGEVFGVLLRVADEEEAGEAARRCLAAAAALGAGEVRAGMALYPEDAASGRALLEAAGEALEAAFESGAPGALVAAGRARGTLERRGG